MAAEEGCGMKEGVCVVVFKWANNSECLIIVQRITLLNAILEQPSSAPKYQALITA